MRSVNKKLQEAKSENAFLRERLDDEMGARQIAGDAADRFRDVLCECLGLDENPGDDVLVATIRARFGKFGPEPTLWRNYVTAARAVIDHIQAMPNDDPMRGWDTSPGLRQDVAYNLGWHDAVGGKPYDPPPARFDPISPPDELK
jgi:hypothetical protein